MSGCTCNGSGALDGHARTCALRSPMHDDPDFVPPGRFELTEEDFADLPVVDLSSVLNDDRMEKIVRVLRENTFLDGMNYEGAPSELWSRAKAEAILEALKA